MIPGELMLQAGEIELNAGRKTVKVNVANAGDRPIQVGSHFHFFETNEALQFDRAAARGFRLNIAAGTAVRFEPGQQREVELVALAGDRIVYGFNAKVMGALDKPRAAPTPSVQGRAGRRAPLRRREADASRNPASAPRKRGRVRTVGKPVKRGAKK